MDLLHPPETPTVSPGDFLGVAKAVVAFVIVFVMNLSFKGLNRKKPFDILSRERVDRERVDRVWVSTYDWHSRNTNNYAK